METNLFAGKRIVVGVTGSIAAFKVAGWVSDLAKEEAQVMVVMTAAAERFVTPLTFAALSGNTVHTTMFADGAAESMAHIELAREADCLLIAPASADVMAKLAAGLADDLLTTTVLAANPAAVVVCPAMNSRMYAHPATQRNLAILRQLGYAIIEPATGMMACKEEGQGRLAEWEEVKERLARRLSPQDLRGVRVLVTAGPTREAIDPARYISNRSSGKMGYAIARGAWRRGAEVVLVSGPTALPPPLGVRLVKVTSAMEMHDSVLSLADDCQVVIKAAAVADFRPETCHRHKVKKEKAADEIRLARNPDILLTLGQRKRPGQVLVGFAAESDDLLGEGRRKLAKKNLDLIAVNDIGGSDTGFEVESNQLHLVSASGVETLPHVSKLHCAGLLLDRVAQRLTEVSPAASSTDSSA